MNGEMIGGLVRHLLTTFGGGIAAWGGLSGDQWTTVVGAAAILAGAAWSMIVKRITPPKV